MLVEVARHVITWVTRELVNVTPAVIVEIILKVTVDGSV